MLQDASFLDEEGDSPLLARGFRECLQEHGGHIAARVTGWVELLPGAHEEVEFNQDMENKFEADA